jgi:hypothetical protein
MKVLELMGETGTAFTNKDTGEIELTFEQFATIAALSEKVSSLDGATRKAANDMDFEALEQKMLKAKEIFFLYDTKNAGEIPLEDVQVILKAGRIAVEHENEVMEQLAGQGMDSLSFLDFLAYVPLFMDIHEDINANTLTTAKRSAMQKLLANKSLGKRWAKKATSARAPAPEAGAEASVPEAGAEASEPEAGAKAGGRAGAEAGSRVGTASSPAKTTTADERANIDSGAVSTANKGD